MTSARDPLATLGRRARSRRQALGLTLRALSETSGLSTRFLMTVESGRGNISVRRLGDLATALESTPGELLMPDAEAAPPVVALLGLRGSGKTTIGRQLARRLRVRFVELDAEIEARAGLALGEIFSLHGEDYYRRLEREVLAALLDGRQPMVLATGGGLVTSPETFALLEHRATTIWLRASAEDYWTRVARQGDRRPMTGHPQAREALAELVARRHPLYGRAAHTIDTSGRPIAETVRAVAAVLS